MQLLRHLQFNAIKTKLDPIEDVLNLITALKSAGFTADLLRDNWGFANKKEIEDASKLIALYIDSSLRFANQAFAGPAEAAYLPLYYSCLNLMKVNIIFLGKKSDLENNRWHGARYDEEVMSKNLLTETLQIDHKGAIPLIYRLITNITLPKAKSKLKISLGDIFGQISSVSAEYLTATGGNSQILPHTSHLIGNVLEGYHFELRILSERLSFNPPAARAIKAYPGLSLVQSAGQLPFYRTKTMKGDQMTIFANYRESCRLDLISDSYDNLNRQSLWVSYTPITGKKHVFSEELNILLAFFYLSNVVRCNPEHLDKLMNSKYWIILLALRKHGFLRLITLMWGNFNRMTFDTSPT